MIKRLSVYTFRLKVHFLMSDSLSGDVFHGASVEVEELESMITMISLIKNLVLLLLVIFFLYRMSCLAAEAVKKRRLFGSQIAQPPPEMEIEEFRGARSDMFASGISKGVFHLGSPEGNSLARELPIDDESGAVEVLPGQEQVT